MKLLVITAEPIEAAQLEQAVPDDLDREQTEVMVVAPALQASPLRFWFSDADEAIARATEVSDASVSQLEAEGISASGDTGESDPLQAIQDALQTFPAERILLFTHRGEESAYREDIDPAEVQERFGVPAELATV